jgi:hypothetical protein
MDFSNNNILNIIISLTLIYALLSILVSILLEWWNHYKKARARQLKDAIGQLLKDPLNLDYGDLFYSHFMVNGLTSGDAKPRPPQYISSKMFSEVLIDIIARQYLLRQEIKLVDKDNANGKQYELVEAPPCDTVLEKFEAALKLMNASPFRDVLLSFWEKSEGQYDKLKTLIEHWYDNYMDRVSGWYKTKQKTKFVFFGFLVAFGLNIDSIHLVKILSLDKDLQNKLVKTAEGIADNYQAVADSADQSSSALVKNIYGIFPDSLKGEKAKRNDVVSFLIKKDSVKYSNYIKKLHLNDSITQKYVAQADSVLGLAASLNLPIGWDAKSAPASWFGCYKGDHVKKSSGLLAYNAKRNYAPDWWTITLYIIGIAISSVSLSFGAPFWFDLLIKFVNIRRAGNKPESTVQKS